MTINFSPEVNMFRKHSNYYGYVVYIMQTEV
jgi:hypothetical protein